jgi:hypothetical protein
MLAAICLNHIWPLLLPGSAWIKKKNGAAIVKIIIVA